MKLKFILFVFALFFAGMQNTTALNATIHASNSTMVLSTTPNSIIVSARNRIYVVNMQNYHATLLTTSPYVSIINSLATDASSGWIFYVGNQASSGNWNVYGYNVYNDVHKSFGSIRDYFWQTGHAYSPRGLGSGGATFYNGKLYLAMEYPNAPFSVYKTSSLVTSNFDKIGKKVFRNNQKESLKKEVQKESTLINDTVLDYEMVYANNMKDDDDDNHNHNGDGDGDDNDDNDDDDDDDDDVGYHDGNVIYLLEVSFDHLSDASGVTTAIVDASPKYDNDGYSSFLYYGELGDIAVSDCGEIYACTSYQIQHFNLNNDTFSWANNEDVYAQIAKDRNSHFQLIRNRKHHGKRKSYVQRYNQPNQLHTYNNIQLGSLHKIKGLKKKDRGRITDAADYVNFHPAYTIQGSIFDDDNEDGVFDTAESLLPNVTVELYEDTNADGVLDAGEPLLDSVTTPSGMYDFAGLSASNVLVKVILPASTNTDSFTLTTPEVVAVQGGGNVSGIDFGINKKPFQYRISGNIWQDLDGNGVQDTGEYLLDSMLVNLIEDTNNNGVLDATDVILQSTQTQSSSVNYSYEFLNVAPQLVFIQVIPDAVVYNLGGSFTYDFDSGTVNADGVVTLNLTSDQNGINFGFYENAIPRISSSAVLQHVQLYPNPTTNVLFVTSNKTLEGEFSLYIFNETGKQVFAKKVHAIENSFELDVHQLSTGTYYLKVVSYKEVFIKRFMKK